MQQYSSFRNRLIVAAKGFAMGLADIIPGVSGGTIALISGIYDHLIHAIGSVEARHALSAVQLVVFCWHGEKRRAALEHLSTIEWRFLIPLLSGIVVAMLIMTRIIPFVLENYAFHAYAFFFGLILFSISVPFRMMKHRWQEFVVLALAAIGVYFLVGISRVSNAQLEIRPEANASNNAASEITATLFADAKGKWHLQLPAEARGQTFRATVTTAHGEPAGSFVFTVPAASTSAPALPAFDDADLLGLGVVVRDEGEAIDVGGAYELSAQLIARGNPEAWFVLLSGALAICAMILPGISGAYILVILGQYRLTLAAVSDLVDAIKNTLLTGQLSAELVPALTIVLAFVLGIALGIFSFVRLLRWLLDRYHSLTMAALTGLMIGSLRGIWPVNHLHGASLTGELIAIGVVLTIVGAVAIFALEKISKTIDDPEPPIA